MNEVVITAGDKFQQVGQFATRRPDGTFDPAVPLFALARDANKRNERTGRSMAEEITSTDVTKLFAEKFKIYAESMEAGAVGDGL